MNESKISNELLNAALEAGRNALKASVVINGAASLSILTFIGSIANGKEAKIVIKSLSAPLAYFVCGVFTYALASGITYIAQSIYYYFPKSKWGNIVNLIAVVLVLSSYICFAFGSYEAYKAFLAWP